MKTCNKCGDEKELEEFTIDKRLKSGRQGICRECCSKYRKKHRKENEELYSIRNKEKYKNLSSIELQKKKDYEKKYREENKEYFEKYYKQYYKENEDYFKKHRKEHKEERNKHSREYFKNNREYFKEKKKEYYNSEKGKETRRKWHNKYNQENPHIVAWRSIMRRMVLQLQFNKIDSTYDTLGYSAEELKTHIKGLFLSGMSWENYGDWHIDHTTSVSLFNKNTPPSIVNALSNLKPMWATTRKIDGIIYEGNLNKGNNLE